MVVRARRLAFVGALLMAAGCTMPATRRPALSAEEARLEQREHEQLIIRAEIAQAERVENIGHRLLQAAAGYCERHVTARTGIKFANAYSFGLAYERAARSLGFSDTLMVVSVPVGSSAERAGVQRGDRLLGIEGKAAPQGRWALLDVQRMLTSPEPRQSVLLSLVGGATWLDAARTETGDASEPRHLHIDGDTACPFDLRVVRGDELHAYADDRTLVLHTSMVSFAETDVELATVVAHELAHHTLRHVGGRIQNARLGALFGGIVDVAPTPREGNGKSELMKRAMQDGALVYSSELELESDHAALYIIAHAGFDASAMSHFWRRLAQEKQPRVRYAATHPMTFERSDQMNTAVRELGTSTARGELPQPKSQAAPVPPSPTVAMMPASAGANGGAPAEPKPREARAIPRTATTPKNRIPGDPTADIFYWVYGPPLPVNGLTVAQVRLKARHAYMDGLEFREVGLWDKARDKFFEATQLDGAEPVYQAALGMLLLKQGLLVEAEGVLSAAALLEPSSTEYRRLLGDVKVRRLQKEVERRKP